MFDEFAAGGETEAASSGNGRRVGNDPESDDCQLKGEITHGVQENAGKLGPGLTNGLLDLLAEIVYRIAVEQQADGISRD